MTEPSNEARWTHRVGSWLIWLMAVGAPIAILFADESAWRKVGHIALVLGMSLVFAICLATCKVCDERDAVRQP